MECPKCGSRMSIGAPHDPERDKWQYECHNCGKIVTVPRDVR